MTRTLLYTLTGISFAVSCKTQDNKDWTKETFILQDSTHQIEVSVPEELDSFYTWVDYNDTPCGHRRRYRFSSSKHPIFQESGFYQLTHPDSSYQVTFSHSYYTDCFRGWKADLDHIIGMNKERAARDSVDFEVKSAERINVNGIPFNVLIFKTVLLPKQYQSSLIWAYANIDSINLEVEYECALKNCDFFIDKMEQSLKTIKVSKRN